MNTSNMQIPNISGIGRLVLQRAPGDGIRFKTSDGEINITFLKTSGEDAFKVVIEAPKSVEVVRTELKDKNE